MCIVRHCGRSGRRHFITGTFRHGDFSARGIFGTGTFRHPNISALGYFGILDIPTRARLDTGFFRQGDFSALGLFGTCSFRHGDFSARARFGTGTFRHEDFSARARFGMETFRHGDFWHLEFSWLGFLNTQKLFTPFFGLVDIDKDLRLVLENIWPKCGQNTLILKSPHAENTACRKVPMSKRSRDEMSSAGTSPEYLTSKLWGDNSVKEVKNYSVWGFWKEIAENFHT